MDCSFLDSRGLPTNCVNQSFDIANLDDQTGFNTCIIVKLEPLDQSAPFWNDSARLYILRLTGPAISW